MAATEEMGSESVMTNANNWFGMLYSWFLSLFIRPPPSSSHSQTMSDSDSHSDDATVIRISEYQSSSPNDLQGSDTNELKKPISSPLHVQNSCTTRSQTSDSWWWGSSSPAGSCSSTASTSSRSTEGLPTFSTNREEVPNSIVELFRGQELGKVVMGFVMPITTVLISVYHNDSSSHLPWHFILMSLPIGVTALFSGILLRDSFPKLAIILELLGAASILFAFFGVVGTLVPPTIAWVSWVCFVVSLLPFVLIWVPLRERSSELRGSNV
ncbi:unnamed protein product [Ilex paraguariensis]|uniref:Uncharacterized protein n=1 Tax=Ilex paraguariensis TaxID=185542 RepID=A0ABC8SJ88_9AQUA